MKCAVLSDIHGNQYALDRVLESAEKEGVERLLLLGDYVGYYYGAHEVLDRVCAWEHDAVGGNHEAFLLRAEREPDYLAALTEKYGHSYREALERLGGHHWHFLRSLPDKQEIDVGGYRILLCHGSPWDANAYVYPDADEASLARFDALDVDFVFFGHTHYTATFERGHVRVINPGSVGQSRQKGGVAFWGIFDSARGVYTPMQTPYPITALEKEVKAKDPHLLYNLAILTR